MLVNLSEAKEEKHSLEKDFKNNKVIHHIAPFQVTFYNDAAHELTLQDFNDKFIILIFWASWCLECEQNLKSLDLLEEKLITNKIEDIRIIPISIDFKNIETLKDIYQKYNIKHIKLFFDPYKELMMDMHVNSLPKAFFIDKTLNVVYKFNKIIDWNNKEVYQYILKIKNITLGKNAAIKNNKGLKDKVSTTRNNKKIIILK